MDSRELAYRRAYPDWPVAQSLLDVEPLSSSRVEARDKAWAKLEQVELHPVQYWLCRLTDAFSHFFLRIGCSCFKLVSLKLGACCKFTT